MLARAEADLEPELGWRVIEQVGRVERTLVRRQGNLDVRQFPLDRGAAAGAKPMGRAPAVEDAFPGRRRAIVGHRVHPVSSERAFRSLVRRKPP